MEKWTFTQKCSGQRAQTWHKEEREKRRVGKNHFLYVCCDEITRNLKSEDQSPVLVNFGTWGRCCLLSTPDIPSPLPITLYSLREFQIVLEVGGDLLVSFLQSKEMNQSWFKPVIVILFPTANDWSQDRHVNQFWTMRLKGKTCWGVSLSRKKKDKLSQENTFAPVPSFLIGKKE